MFGTASWEIAFGSPVAMGARSRGITMQTHWLEWWAIMPLFGVERLVRRDVAVFNLPDAGGHLFGVGL
jgi:hypothetical protein